MRSIAAASPERGSGSDRAVQIGVVAAEVLLITAGFLLGHPIATGLIAAAVAFFLLAYRYPDVAWILVWASVPPNVEVLLGTGTAITVPTEPMMMLAILAWLLRQPAGKPWSLPQSRLNLPLACLSGFVLLSVTWSLNPINTLKSWLMMGGYVVFGYLYFLQGSCDARRRDRWLRSTAIIGAAWGLFGIVRVLFTGVASVKLAMIASTYAYGAFRPFFREHGTYSAYLGMLLPAMLFFALERRGRERLLYGVSAVLIASGVVLAFARAGWLAIVLVIPLATMAWAWRHRSGRRLLAPAIAVLVLTLLAAASGISRQVTRHAGTTVSTANLSNLERLNRWTAALAITRDHPWTGVGFGCYLDAYRTYREKSVVTDQAFLRMGTHSEPLKLLSELGIPGFLVAVWFILSVFVLGWRAFWNLPDREDRVLALAALAGFGTYVVNGMFNSYLVEDKVTIPFWSAIGILAALGRKLER